MKKSFVKIIALLIVCVMTLTACGNAAPAAAPAADGSAPAAAEAAAAPSNLAGITNTYDLFTDKYPALAGQTHVFQTAEYGEIYHYLLGGRYHKASGNYFEGERSFPVTVADGNYIFLIGGSWSDEMQGAIGYINDVAKEYGIQSIYNFDPHLDGCGDDSVVNLLADPGEEPAEGASDEEVSLYTTRFEISQRGDALANALYYWDGYTDPEHPERLDLNGDIENGATRNDIKAPSLIIWNKNNAGSPVVGELTWTTADTKDEAAFKASVSALFDKISTNKQADAINLTPGQYFLETITARYGNATSEATFVDIDGNPIMTTAGTELMLKDWPIFPKGTEDTMFEVITLEELEGIFKSEGNYAVMFGGLWCPNCHSTIRAIYENAQKFNIGKIYYFDPELESGGNNTATSMRNNNRPLTAKKYIDIFNTYLTNIGLGDDQFGSRFDIDFKNLVTSIELRKAEGRLVETDPEDNATNYNADGTLTQAAKDALFLTGGAGDGYAVYEKVPGSADDHAPIPNAQYASRIHYPCLVMYNKDHVDANGNPAPVIAKFAQLYRSGGGNTQNPMPNSLGRLSEIYGRLYEFTEYSFGDSSKATATHNSDTSEMIPKTNELVLASYGLAPDENGFDPRGLEAPITSRTCWYGLLDVFGHFSAYVIQSNIDALADQAASNNGLKKAIKSAEKAVEEFNKCAAEADNWINEKINAPLDQTRLTARESIVPYTDCSEQLTEAYNGIMDALN